MIFQLLSAAMVDVVHDEVLNPGELQGSAMSKSLEGALGRVDNRLVYGMISDVFDLAAAYAVTIAQGQCFNDANERTAYRVMQTCLELHGLDYPDKETEIGPVIIRAAKGLLDEGELAHWLRIRV